MAPLIPPSALLVKIHGAKTPSCFWATEEPHEGMSEERRELRRIEQRISEGVRRKSNPPCLEDGEEVAVRSRHDDRVWHRGKIEYCLQTLSGNKYAVRLLDQGVIYRAKPKDISKLPYNCDTTFLPPQALLLTLEDTVPLNLNISFNFDALNHEVSNTWSPNSESFIAEEVLKNYAAAYFVEGEYSRSKCCRFGDLLLRMGHKDELISLRDLLCAEKHAMKSKQAFLKMYKCDVELKEEGPEVTVSPFVAPSPAGAMMSDLSRPESIPQNRLRTMAEFAEEREALKSSTPLIAERPTDADAPHNQMSPPSELNHVTLLMKLKMSRKVSTSPSELKSSCLSVGPSAGPSSQQSPGRIEIPLNVPPKDLGSAFVPAGRSIKSEKKDKIVNRSYSPRSAVNGTHYNSDSTLSDGLNNGQPSRNTSACTNIPSRWELSDGSTSDGQMPQSVNMQMRLKKAIAGTAQLPASKDTTSSDLSRLDSINSPLNGCRLSTRKNAQTDIPPPLALSDGSISDGGKSLNRTMHSMLKKLVAGKAELPASEERVEVPVAAATARKFEAMASVAAKCETALPSSGKSEGFFSSPPAVASVHSMSMKDRLLRPVRIKESNDDDMKGTEYLARSILLHGGLPPTPWMTSHDLKQKFSTHIEQLLINKKWYHNLLTLEKFMWPAIQQRQNVIMISPKKSGKTTSFVVPLMDFMIVEPIRRGNGPLVLILCSGSKAVSHIHSECVKLVNEVKKAPRIQFASGLALNEELYLKLLNGCEVFVTTPPCLLRILKEQKYRYALNLNRLQHFVLDEADILMSRFLDQLREIQSFVVTEQQKRSKTLDEIGPIQFIVASEKWEPHFLSFSNHLRSSPLLCINDCYEACVYGKVDVVLEGTHPEKKPSKLLGILRNMAGLHKVVVFCDESEISHLEEYLSSFIQMLVFRQGVSLVEMQGLLHLWDSSSDGQHYVLLCSDVEFDDLKLLDATIIVHYSLPSEDRTLFVKRLSAVLSNIPHVLEGKKPKMNPSIHILVDETNGYQLPFIAKLMQRITYKIDQNLKILFEAAKTEENRKEKKTKTNKLFCKNLKMFGHCPRDGCHSRHVYMPELDDSNHLPKSGAVSMQIVQVQSAGHFSVRLTEQSSYMGGNNKKVASDGGYLKLALKMSAHFLEERSLPGEIIIGEIYAIETIENLYNRVQIVDVLEKDKQGKPFKVEIQFIDEGRISSARVSMLCSLPDELKDYPSQVVDVFLCGLLPADLDDDYCRDATRYIQNLVKKTQAEERFFQGNVVLSMTGSLWIDPLNIIEWLPLTQAFVVRENVRKCLLEQHHALENPQHVTTLFNLCGKSKAGIIAAPATSVFKKPKQHKPDWAFLESDTFEDVEVMWAYDDGVIIIRRKKFLSLLDKLIEDINKEPPKRKMEEIATLSSGDMCLSWLESELKWNRAKILSKNDDGTFVVFYVDYGDKGYDVSADNLSTISDWAVTRLPCQAIECNLAGVASWDSSEKFCEATEGKDLLAKVCEQRKEGILTGGHHYLVVLVDPRELSILNKDLLKFEGVEVCQDQLSYLDFELCGSLFNRHVADDKSSDSNDLPNPEEVDSDLSLSDLEFHEEDLSAIVDDDFGDFEVCGEEFFIKNIPELQKLVAAAADGKHNAPSLSQSISANNKPISKENIAPNHHPIENDVEEEDRGDELSDWEEDIVYIGRYPLPALCNARPPKTKWFEDLYYVWIKFCITGVDKYYLQCSFDNIQFSTLTGGRVYHLNQGLRGVILPGSVQSSVKGFTVEVKMKKAFSGVMWDRPFSARQRFKWLSRDLEASNVDSSDSECAYSLDTINKEIRKIPLKQRRIRLRNPNKPDMLSDSEDNRSGCETIDSDEFYN